MSKEMLGDYNSAMNNGRPSEEVLRLIRFASLLWLAYLVILIVIGSSFHEPQLTNPLYYILLGLISLVCFSHSSPR